MNRRGARILLGVVLFAAALLSCLRFESRWGPAVADVTVTTHGSFVRNGEYPGARLARAAQVRLWGSWAGSDYNHGSLRLGPFPAPRRLVVALSGYPLHPGNEVLLQLAGTTEQQTFSPPSNIGERWRLFTIAVPKAWVGKPMTLLARDRADGLGGWLGISEPIRSAVVVTGTGLPVALLASAVTAVLLGLLFWAAYRIIARRGEAFAPWIPLIAGGVVATAGYAAFWAYFIHPLLGKGFALALLVLAAVFVLRSRRQAPRLSADARAVVQLWIVIGFFYVCLLHLFASSSGPYQLAADRFLPGRPAANLWPHDLGAKLYAHHPPRNPGAEWLSSDRPPLQAGWLLLTWPVTRALGFRPHEASLASAIWFQLLWIAAVYALLRSAGLEPRRATAWTLLIALSGFTVLNSVNAAPDLAAGAFTCGGFAVWFLVPGRRRGREFALGGWLAALGWLTHGGVAFSLLALAPWVLWRMGRGDFSRWLLAAAGFLVLALPWFAYQKFYDPPGDRLVRMELAGVAGRDNRSTWSTVRDSYHAKPWSWIVDAKKAGFETLVAGDWPRLFDFRPSTAAARRADEFSGPLRALTWWLFGALALGLGLLRQRSRAAFAAVARQQVALAAWTAGTLVLWCLLLFNPGTALLSQGSSATLLALFVLSSVWFELTDPRLIGGVALLQAATFATTWVGPGGNGQPAPTGWPLAVLSAAILGVVFVQAIHPTLVPCLDRAKAGWNRLSTAASRPDRRLDLAAAFVGLVLLILRKPWALRTPQLWAEDGSIFLNDMAQYGAASLLRPYQGYLHLIPRLTAWIAAQTADVRWWPLMYNLGALLVAAAVLFRLTSPRLAVTHRRLLILAFALVAQSGEVLFNITNAQWLAAFLLMIQLWLTEPRSKLAAAADVALLILAGLTGPFVVLLLPLFAWQAWRQRNRYRLGVLAVVVACAGIQISYLLQAYGQTPPPTAFHFFNYLGVLSARLVVWPFLGAHLVAALPAAALVGIGAAVAIPVLIWTVRDRHDRPFALEVLVILAILLAAATWRSRPDEWSLHDVSDGDRYFFIPRVLFVWLVVWLFDARPRRLAVTLVALCLAGVATELPDHYIPAPPDYHWAAHCDPIRRGVPATIPTLPDGWTFHYPGRPQR